MILRFSEIKAHDAFISCAIHLVNLRMICVEFCENLYFHNALEKIAASMEGIFQLSVYTLLIVYFLFLKVFLFLQMLAKVKFSRLILNTISIVFFLISFLSCSCFFP